MNRKADCIFCKILDGAIPSPRLYEDEHFICIRDVHPQAKTHLLVIPKMQAGLRLNRQGHYAVLHRPAMQECAPSI